jgi:hypothetical protein
MVGMDDWGWEHVDRWTEGRVRCRSARCSAFSLDRPADAAGRRPQHVASFAVSPPRPGCGGELAPHQRTRTRSRWPTKGSRCQLSSGNSGMLTSGSPRSTSRESTPARDRRYGPSPPPAGDPGQRRPAPVTGPVSGPVTGASRARRPSPTARSNALIVARTLPIVSASGHARGPSGV